MRAYGEREMHGKYTLEDYGGWSRNHTKVASIRRWKRPLKKRAGVPRHAETDGKITG